MKKLCFLLLFFLSSLNLNAEITNAENYSNSKILNPLFRPSNVSIYAPETVITNYQSAAALSKGSQGTLTDDTSDFIKGNSSVVLTSNSSTEAHGDIKGLTLNFTGKQLVCYVKISDVSLLNNASGYARIVLGTDDDYLFSNSWAFTISNLKLNSSQTSDASNIWHKLIFNWNEGYAVAGTVNRASIKSIRFQMDDNNNAIKLKINSIATIAEPAAGFVTISFDDGYESQYTVARKIMDAYGFKGVIYTIPGAIGISGYMTLDQLKKLQDAGWDISAHYATNLTTIPAYTVESVLRDVKSWLIINGFKGYDYFAYPNGAFNQATVLPAVKKLFKAARSIASDYPESYPPSDIYKLRVFSILNTTTTASIATAIDNARINKEWLHLVFHKIGSSGELTTMTEANFQTIITDIASDGVLVKTNTEVLY